jgi:hypothetical protein
MLDFSTTQHNTRGSVGGVVCALATRRVVLVDSVDAVMWDGWYVMGCLMWLLL